MDNCYREPLHPIFEENVVRYTATIDLPGRGDTYFSIYKYKTIYKSEEISEYIKRHNNVFVSSDLHISRGERVRKNIPDIIRNRHNKIVGKNDLVIFLGDLTDPECYISEEKFIKYMKSLKGDKILILGNNDTFPISVYKKAGIKYIIHSLEHEGIIFTHLPHPTDKINIHGHIHRGKYYFDVPVTKQINVYNDNNNYYPYRLTTLLKQIPKGTTIWSKEYKNGEVPEIS